MKRNKKQLIERTKHLKAKSEYQQYIEHRNKLQRFGYLLYETPMTPEYYGYFKEDFPEFSTPREVAEQEILFTAAQGESGYSNLINRIDKLKEDDDETLRKLAAKMEKLREKYAINSGNDLRKQQGSQFNEAVNNLFEELELSFINVFGS